MFQTDLRDQLAKGRSSSIVAYPSDSLLAYPALVEFVGDRLPEGRFVILGESFSGPIAVEIAARLPDKVAGVILAASFVRRPVAFGNSLARAWLSARLPRFRAVISAGLFGQFATPERTRILQEALNIVPHQTFAFRIGEIASVDKRRRLSDVQCPLLYMHGRRDVVVRRNAMQTVLNASQTGTAAYVDGPHAFLTTHVAESVAAVEAFVATLP